MPAFPDDLTWAFAPTGSAATLASVGMLQARVFAGSGHIQLVGPDLEDTVGAVVISLAPPAASTAHGTVQLETIASTTTTGGMMTIEYSVGDSRVTAQLSFPHEGVLRYEVSDWGDIAPQATAIAGAMNGDEHVYGFGEKFKTFDQLGQRVDVLTFDDPGTKGDHSYKVAPWFVSTRGYGFHLDSSAESMFDMAAGGAGRFVATNRFSTLAFNLVYGPALSDVLTRYTGYNGRPTLPPPWAFGPWISSDVWGSGGELRYAVTQFHDRGIPASAIVFDSPWETAYNDFAFNMTQFGADATIDGTHYAGFESAAAMFEFLRANGLKAICWMAPLVNVSSDDEHIPGQNLGQAPNYADGVHSDVFVRTNAGGAPLVVPWWKGRGSPIDFTSAAAREWLSRQLHTLIDSSMVTTASGSQEPVVSGFKTDDGESGNGPNTYIPLTAAYSDGRTGVEMRNGYCLEYHRAVWSVLGAAGVLFARSGFAGSHAFPGYWAGDNEPNFGDNGLPSVIVAGQSAAMSAYSIWGHDVGGYQDTNFSQSPPDLFMRWAQFGCFSPIMQMHRQVARELQYPWQFGDEALANYQFFARLHTRLFPYIYTYARLASTTGLPIIRPLVLLDQRDPHTFEVNHTYCFGNELLVAPTLTPNSTTRTLYLPRGDWFDFWTSAPHSGGQILTWDNENQAQLPLFVRAGAIIPMLATDVRTLCDANYVDDPTVTTRTADLLFQLYPSGSSSFDVFDGTQVRCDASDAGGTVTIVATVRDLTLRILANAPASVTRDGQALPQAAAPGGPGWRFDQTTGFIEIVFSHPGGDTAIGYST